LNVHNVSDVRQTEVYSAEPSWVWNCYGKKYKWPGNNQILAEMIQAEGEKLLPAFHKLVNSIWKKEGLPDYWKKSIIVSVHKKGDNTDCSNYLHTKLYWISFSYTTDEIISDHQCRFRRNRSTTDQIFCIRQILEEKWKYNQTVHQLFIDFKKAYDSVRKDKVRIGKHLSDSLPKTRRCSITTAFQLCFRIRHYEGPGKQGGTEIEWDTSSSGLWWCVSTGG
jgi:hypothetical protein